MESSIVLSSEAKDIIDKVRYATISTVDGVGSPWAAPVWYVYDNQSNIYWWSPVDSRHSRNITLNGQVYITIFDSSASEGDGVGLYIRADASQVTSNELDSVIEMYNAATTKFKLDLSNTTGDAPTRLYKAVPITVQINDGVESGGFYRDIRRDLNR